jgi:hypothetical protein
VTHRRRELELRVIEAIVDLAEDMDCDAFALPIPDSDPRYFVCWGQAGDISSLLGQTQATVVADAGDVPGANDPHA